MASDTVLTPLDGSTIAEVAVPYAEAVARITGAGVRLLRVLDAGHAAETGATEGAPTGRQASEDALRALAAAACVRGAEAEAVTAVGDPIAQIIAAAEAPDVTLVIMATQGQSGLKRWYLGGVADAVLRTTTKPVLVIPPEAGGRAGSAVRFTRIAVPLDGSALAETALPVAEGLARPANGQVILLHVQPASAATPTDAGGAADAYAYLAAAQGKLRDAAAATTVALSGTPSDAIVEHLAAHPVDLLVLTTHGRGGRRHLVLGSTAYRLLHADIPMLLVRSEADLARLRM